MVDLELVERLRKRTNISYEEAKEILGKTNGDILEAIIILEKENRIKAPPSGGYYHSQGEEQENKSDRDYGVKQEEQKRKKSSFYEQVSTFLKYCGKIIHKGNTNCFEVLKDGNIFMRIPITVCALLLIFTSGFVIPLIIVGLLFGYRYQFKGPDLDKTQVNQTVETVSNATRQAVDSVVHAVGNFSKETKKNKDETYHGENPHC